MSKQRIYEVALEAIAASHPLSGDPPDVVLIAQQALLEAVKPKPQPRRKRVVICPKITLHLDRTEKSYPTSTWWQQATMIANKDWAQPLKRPLLKYLLLKSQWAKHEQSTRAT